MRYYEVVKEFINSNNDVEDFIVIEGGFHTYDDALKYINNTNFELGEGEQISIWDCKENGELNDYSVILK